MWDWIGTENPSPYPHSNWRLTKTDDAGPRLRKGGRQGYMKLVDTRIDVS